MDASGVSPIGRLSSKEFQKSRGMLRGTTLDIKQGVDSLLQQVSHAAMRPDTALDALLEIESFITGVNNLTSNDGGYLKDADISNKVKGLTQEKIQQLQSDLVEVTDQINLKKAEFAMMKLAKLGIKNEDELSDVLSGQSRDYSCLLRGDVVVIEKTRGTENVELNLNYAPFGTPIKELLPGDSGNVSGASSTESLVGAAADKSEAPPSYSERYIVSELNNSSNHCYIEENALYINPVHARPGDDSGQIIDLDTVLDNRKTVREVVREQDSELLEPTGGAAAEASAVIAGADLDVGGMGTYIELGPEDVYLTVVNAMQGASEEDTYIQCMAAAVVSQPTAHKPEGHKSVLNINQSREASDEIFDKEGNNKGDFLFRVTSSASDIELDFGPVGGQKNVGKFCLKCDVQVGVGSEGRWHYALSPQLYDSKFTSDKAHAAKTSLNELMVAFNSNAADLNTKLLEHINQYEKSLPDGFDLNTCLNNARPAIALGSISGYDDV